MKRRRQYEIEDTPFFKKIHLEEISKKRKNHFDDSITVKRQRISENYDLRKQNFELQEQRHKLIIMLNSLANENKKLKYLLSCQKTRNEVTYDNAIQVY